MGVSLVSVSFAGSVAFMLSFRAFHRLCVVIGLSYMIDLVFSYVAFRELDSRNGDPDAIAAHAMSC